MATFGQTNSANAEWNIFYNDRGYGAKFQCSQSGQLDSVSIHLNSPVDGDTLYVAIYNDNSGAVGTKVASGTGTVVGSSDQWVTVSLSAALVAGNYYWLCANQPYTGNGYFHGLVSGGTVRARWAETAGVWTDNPASVTYNAGYDMCAYATYTPDIGPGGLKKISTVAKTYVKNIFGVSLANIKKVAGVA